MELLGGALSVAAVMFGVQRADAQALAEMAGGSGLAGVVAANPLAIIAAAAAMVLAWRIHVKGDCWEPLVRRAATGTAAAATAIAAGSLLGGFAATGALPLIISIGLSLIAGLVVKHFLNRAAAAGTSTDVAAQACPGQDANALRMHVVQQARQIRDALDETALRVLRRALA